MITKQKIIYLLSVFSFISVGWGCDEGYTEIDGECYYQSDLDVLQQFIDNSQEGFMPPPYDMSPIDLGVQEWENGRIVFLCYSYIGESECYIYDYILSGEIPPDIGNLVELRNLILTWSELNGEIPPSIVNLTNLTELKLHYNQLTGEIPIGLGNMTNLTDLYLRENQLTGEIPTDIWGLVNLNRLFLEYNELSGEIPETFGDLVNLSYCNLKHNQFSGQIPESIGNFENMIGLSLAHNQLSGIIPDSICNLVENSNFIYLYGNQLCPPYPECLSEEQLNGSWQTGGGEEDEQDTSECESDPQIGDECVTQDGWIGFYDCELCCWDEWIIENWLGDGYCDQFGGCGWEGPQFDCPELSYDCGDCDTNWDGDNPSGLCFECSDNIEGDLNFDGYVDILDIVILVDCILLTNCDICFDINYDGMIDVLDIILIVNSILEY